MGLASPAIRRANAHHNIPPHYTLWDGNSSVNLDISARATVQDWFVEEPVTGNLIDHLAEISNWYRVDNPPGVPTSAERSVHTLPKTAVASSMNPNPDPRPDTLTVVYRSVPNHFEITIVYNLTGGASGSGFSQLDEDIEIFNTSLTDDLEIHFFEYVDLDLHSTLDGLHNAVDDDTLVLTGPGSLHQSDP